MVYYKDSNIIKSKNLRNINKNNQNHTTLKSPKCKILLIKTDKCITNTKIKLHQLKLFDTTFINRVKQTLQKYSVRTICLNKNLSLLENIIPYVSSTKQNDYTFALYANAPLITIEAVENSINYAMLKELDVCKTACGVIFKNTFLFQPNNTPIEQEFKFFTQDMMLVDNLSDMQQAHQILQNRIIENHLNNGVIIMNPHTCTISDNVDIAPNVTIYSNCTILGNTKIEKGSILYQNCYIKNTLIKENCKVHVCHITDCKINKNTTIKPFSHYSNILINF